MAHFVVTFALLKWSGTESALSPRYSCKIYEFRKKLKRGLLNIKGSGLAGFENSQTFRWQMLKLRNSFQAKIKLRVLSENYGIKMEGKSVAIKSFAKSCVKRNF